MCCGTHTMRDIYERWQGKDMALGTPDKRFLCQCRVPGVSCMRKATEEDMLCDWCRTEDHEKWCQLFAQLAIPGSELATAFAQSWNEPVLVMSP